MALSVVIENVQDQFALILYFQLLLRQLLFIHAYFDFHCVQLI